jgi:hypothetical protein
MIGENIHSKSNLRKGNLGLSLGGNIPDTGVISKGHIVGSFGYSNNSLEIGKSGKEIKEKIVAEKAKEEDRS